MVVWLEIMGACAFSALCLEQLVRAAPDVLIIDSFTSTQHGEFLRRLKDELQDLKIVMIGMDADEQSFLYSVQEGALGYLVKDASAAEIAAAVRTVGPWGGGLPSAAVRVPFSLRCAPAKAIAQLPREGEPRPYQSRAAISSSHWPWHDQQRNCFPALPGRTDGA